MHIAEKITVAALEHFPGGGYLITPFFALRNNQ